MRCLYKCVQEAREREGGGKQEMQEREGRGGRTSLRGKGNIQRLLLFISLTPGINCVGAENTKCFVRICATLPCLLLKRR